MAKDNIYDLIISELILRVESIATTSTAPNIILSSTLPGNVVAAGFNGNTVFTSVIVNIPSGYTIQASSHVINYPVPSPVSTVGGSAALTGPTVNVILGAAGSTFVVDSTVTLIHATLPNIVLNGIFTITSVSPTYYGIKAFSASPDTVGLATIASSANTFQLTTSILGRMYIVTPTSSPLITGVMDQNGLVTVVATDYTITIIGSLRYYILNYDTQLTGTNIKTFTLLY
jgi:hypothetical protein